jgi:drug/metabolite transporter (DMT)-like permease
VIADPKAWRGLSSALLVVFIAAMIIGPDIPRWGWIAAIGSGVAFAVELVLMRRRRAAGRPAE